jgi:hypothetical protein
MVTAGGFQLLKARLSLPARLPPSHRIEEDGPESARFDPGLFRRHDSEPPVANCFDGIG